MSKVLVVGQTPPPFHGQAIMIEGLLKAEYHSIQLFLVRLAFSEDIDDIGKFQLSKVIHLFSIIARIVYSRFRYNIPILYYPPAGPDRIPMYRDLAILISTRWLFKRTILHFHAGGISQLYPQLSPILQLLFRLAYFKADAAIRLSELNPPDGESLRAKREYIIPYGIEDRYSIYKGKKQNQDAACNILFVGALRESKGVLVVLDVANRLRKQGLNFRLNFVGRFKSGQFRQLVFEKVTSYRLEEYVAFLGVLTGDKKWEIFATSDILCFPSFFESETFGLVVLEAMQFALPVVATRWRGIPSLVKDGESGFLVPVKDSRAVAEKLEFLIKNPIMVKQMGQNGRKIYLDEYCFEVYLNRLEQIFLEIGDSR